MLTEFKMNIKLGILILLNMTTFKNWSWHPVQYLEEIQYLKTRTPKVCNAENLTLNGR